MQPRNRRTTTGIATPISLSVLAFSMTSPAHAQSFTGLGFLPGYTESIAYGISGDGSVVVGNSRIAAVGRGFRWTACAGMQDLSTLPGGTNSIAYAASHDGRVVCGAGNVPPNNTPLGIRWTELQTGGRSIDSIGTMPGCSGSRPFGVSADGTILVGWADSTSPPYQNHAFRWTLTGFLDLGTLPEGTTTQATGISADGVVIVGYADSPIGTRAFRWTLGEGMTSLGVMPAGQYSYGLACSQDGSVVVGSGDCPDGDHAFRWTAAAGMIDLGTLPGGSSSQSKAVSADGETVVGWSAPPGGYNVRAFIWTASLGMLDLNAYLPLLGLNLSGWTLEQATGISADGLSIVGYGLHNGRYEAWIATLPTTTCRADLGVQGGCLGRDGILDNNDFIAFISLFFGLNRQADRGSQGGDPWPDGRFDNNDFIVYIDQFFTGC